MRRQLATTCCADTALNSGFNASPKQTALPAMMCISGPPCVPGKIALFDALAHTPLLAKDHAAARTAQGLVGGGGHHISVRNRARMTSRRHQAGDVRHIHHEDMRRPHRQSRANLLKIDDARISAGTRHDQLRFALHGASLSTSS